MALESSRLRCVRIFRGMSRRALADAASIHLPRLRAIERRLVRPREPEAHRLAAALRVRAAMLDGDEVEFVHALAVNVGPRSASAHARARALATLLGQVVIPAIAEHFDQSLVRRLDDRDIYMHSPSLAAEIVRIEAGLAHGPLVSVLGWLEHLGVWCFSLPPEMQAVGSFSFWWGPLRVIVVAERDFWRTRLDAAAHLGRLVLHINGAPGRLRAAVEAVRFAETFLLPTEGLRGVGRIERRTVEALARHYGLPPETAFRRVSSRLAPNTQRGEDTRALRADFRARPIPFPPVRERPQIFEAIADHHRASRRLVASIGLLGSDWAALTFGGPWRPWGSIVGGGEGTGVPVAKLRLAPRTRSLGRGVVRGARHHHP